MTCIVSSGMLNPSIPYLQKVKGQQGHAIPCPNPYPDRKLNPNAKALTIPILNPKP